MNKKQIIFNLLQAKECLDSLISGLEEGSYDESGDMALSVGIVEVMNYLNNSWHYRRMNDYDIENLSQDLYEDMAFSIPCLDARLKMEPIPERSNNKVL